MKTKFSLLTLAAAGLLTAASQLHAEDPVPPTPPATPTAPAASGEAKRARPAAAGLRGERVAPLKEQLGLTDEQVQKLKPILAKDREKLTALRNDTTLTQEQRMAKMKELQKSSEEEIKPILTPEQLEKYKAGQEKRREAMAKRRAAQGNK